MSKRHSQRFRRILFLGLAIGLLLLCLGAAFIINQQINIAPFLSSGEETAVSLPPDFEANIFAQDLDGPRFISFGPDGTLFVADRGNNRIVSLPDDDGDGVADQVNVFAADILNPHSLVYHEGAWYVGVPTGVIRLVDTDEDGVADERTVLIDDYPTSGHSTRTVEFLPDGRMVVSVGSSCNVCDEEDPRRAALVIYDGPQATGEMVYATGLRNAVGLTIHPQSGALWASNNGRDLMGDDTPPETVYRIEAGADYGWPRCHNGDIIDPDMGQPGDCDGVAEPFVEMQAHSAPLGLIFYDGDSFPAEYQGDLFIAFHGSWNRSVPTGYKVVRLPMSPDGQQATGLLQDFATGWLDPETDQASGRPVGLAISPAGDLYVSDDKGGFIYRISYQGAGD